jgi:hypothetical protein
MLALLDEIEDRVTAARDTSDLQELRAILRRPTRVSASERTCVLTVLAAVRDQLEVVRTLRAGLLDSLREARPGAPERDTAEG